MKLKMNILFFITLKAFIFVVSSQSTDYDYTAVSGDTTEQPSSLCIFPACDFGYAECLTCETCTCNPTPSNDYLSMAPSSEIQTTPVCSLPDCDFGYAECLTCETCTCNPTPSNDYLSMAPSSEIQTTPICCLPDCEFGFAECLTCQTCKCNTAPVNGTTTSGPCYNTICPESSDPFCQTYLDYQTCQCLMACCELPFCEFGYSECTSCSNCQCNPTPPSSVSPCNEPCLAPENTNDECRPYRDPETCICHCCFTPICHTGEEAICESCNVCTCPVPTTPNPCDTPCPSSADPFCETIRDPSTCQCLTACCSLPFCEFGFSECTSCSNCKCNPPPSSPNPCDEPCPSSSDPFCETIRDSSTCQCLTACCSLPYCEFGHSECTSCSNCKCNPPPSSPNPCDEPCPKSSDPFCETMRDPSTCQCLTACCSLPFCEFGFSECTSCSNCQCNPPPTSTSTSVKPSESESHEKSKEKGGKPKKGRFPLP